MLGVDSELLQNSTFYVQARAKLLSKWKPQSSLWAKLTGHPIKNLKVPKKSEEWCKKQRNDDKEAGAIIFLPVIENHFFNVSYIIYSVYSAIWELHFV